MKYIQTFEKTTERYEKVVIKLLIEGGRFIVMWKISKQETQCGSSLPERLNPKLHNSSHPPLLPARAISS